MGLPILSTLSCFRDGGGPKPSPWSADQPLVLAAECQIDDAGVDALREILLEAEEHAVLLKLGDDEDLGVESIHQSATHDCAQVHGAGAAVCQYELGAEVGACDAGHDDPSDCFWFCQLPYESNYISDAEPVKFYFRMYVGYGPILLPVPFLPVPTCHLDY